MLGNENNVWFTVIVSISDLFSNYFSYYFLLILYNYTIGY